MVDEEAAPMFVQVIEGRVRDAEGLKRQWQEWMRQLAPDAIGWVGATGGITPDNRFIAAVRFESADNAAQNSNRAEQGRWWSETEKALENVTFDESSDYSATGAPSDDARFAPIMRGGVIDRRRAVRGVAVAHDGRPLVRPARSLAGQRGPAGRRLSPDLLT